VILRLMLGAAALALASPAVATWHKASSAHFVIYADESPDKLREFATKLEKFDRAVRQVRGMADPPMGDGNRLQVFVVPTVRDVQQLGGRTSSGMTKFAGFYQGRAEGSVAIVPEKLDNSSDEADRLIIFFHEYAHHLMYHDLRAAVPLWYSEGFAEFMSTATFARDGSVMLGRVARHRAYSLDDASTLPLESIFAGRFEKMTDDQWESLYSRSWLLTHYLTFENNRKGQLASYLQAVAEGKDSLASAQAAFGDFKVLNRNLHGYLGRNQTLAYKVAAGQVGAIDVQPLSAGAAAVISLRAKSKVGVSGEAAASHAGQMRAIAANYPGDPMVQASLAEAELDADNFAAAEAAADRALAVDPKMIEAMIYKGRAIMQRAVQDEAGATFAAARNWFMKANKLDPEDPEPLMLFHQGQIRDNGRPTPNGIAALHYASNLAPQDLGLRMQSALQYLRDGKLADARKTLAPVAFNPHGGSIAKTARAAMEKIDAGDAKAAEKAMFGN
jgi:tetratricopeptide (TPR) repeat protein